MTARDRAPPGLDVDRRGTVYVAELTYGAPQSQTPPPPSPVGQAIAIAPSGDSE